MSHGLSHCGSRKLVRIPADFAAVSSYQRDVARGEDPFLAAARHGTHRVVFNRCGRGDCLACARHHLKLRAAPVHEAIGASCGMMTVTPLQRLTTIEAARQFVRAARKWLASHFPRGHFVVEAVSKPELTTVPCLVCGDKPGSLNLRGDCLACHGTCRAYAAHIHVHALVDGHRVNLRRLWRSARQAGLGRIDWQLARDLGGYLLKLYTRKAGAPGEWWRCITWRRWLSSARLLSGRWGNFPGWEPGHDGRLRKVDVGEERPIDVEERLGYSRQEVLARICQAEQDEFWFGYGSQTMDGLTAVALQGWWQRQQELYEWYTYLFPAAPEGPSDQGDGFDPEVNTSCV